MAASQPCIDVCGVCDVYDVKSPWRLLNGRAPASTCIKKGPEHLVGRHRNAETAENEVRSEAEKTRPSREKPFYVHTGRAKHGHVLSRQDTW